MCLFWQNLEIVMVFTFYGKNFGQIFPIFFMKPAAGAKFLHWLGDKLQIPSPKLRALIKRHFRHSGWWNSKFLESLFSALWDYIAKKKQYHILWPIFGLVKPIFV